MIINASHAPLLASGIDRPEALLWAVFRHVGQCLDHCLSCPDCRNTTDAGTKKGVSLSKLVAETTFLLRAVPENLRSRAPWKAEINRLAEKLSPLARGPELLISLCVLPALGFQYAAAHINLTRLGFPDAVTDEVLAATTNEFSSPHDGLEIVPNHRLELDWLQGEWARRPALPKAALIAQTCLAKPLDSLNCTLADLYAFSHVILYASDIGHGHFWPPRQTADILADAECGLALALEAGNNDIAAELLWAWPMLGFAFSDTARFVVKELANIMDGKGFVPGPGYHPAEAAGLAGNHYCHYAFSTSYHATLAFGMACAASLQPGLTPCESSLPSSGAPILWRDLLPLAEGERPWQRQAAALPDEQQNSLAVFGLTAALRRAAAARDLNRLWSLVKFANDHQIAHLAVCRQAMRLLSNARILYKALEGNEHLTAAAKND